MCRKCISNLDLIHEELLLACIKAEKVAQDDEAEVNKLKNDILQLNQKAEDNMDAAKLVRNKLRSFLAAQ
jgi:hypothetical protein